MRNVHYQPNDRATQAASQVLGVPADLVRRSVIAYMDVLHGADPVSLLAYFPYSVTELDDDHRTLSEADGAARAAWVVCSRCRATWDPKEVAERMACGASTANGPCAGDTFDGVWVDDLADALERF